ncbi:hypothetical protein CHU98_g12329 [Xylaria longipes]|nr:hypothetical protein CHU98_g12329 [Xylaria longipes]
MRTVVDVNAKGASPSNDILRSGFIAKLEQSLGFHLRGQSLEHFMDLTCHWLMHYELDGPKYSVHEEPEEIVYSRKRITDWLMAIDTQSAPLSPGNLGSPSPNRGRGPRRPGSGEVRKWKRTRDVRRWPNRPYLRQRARMTHKLRPKYLGAYLTIKDR